MKNWIRGRNRRRGGGRRRLWRIGAVAVAVVALAVPAWALWTITVRNGGCPSAADLREYQPPEASQVFAMDGSLVADLSPQRRVLVDLREVEPLVRDGFVAVEDRRFWQHGGVDGRSVVRAIWRDLTSLSFREGFSTITMQLARNVFPEKLPRAKLLSRKLCEVVTAYKIEGELEKEEILELYLNQVYLGAGLYGVEAAAQGYFAKPAQRLTAAEAALLIGLVKAPTYYNPRRHPLRSIQRRNVVLDVMAREGVIATETAERARAAPLALAPPLEAAGSAPFFVAAVRAELRERFGSDADIRGLRVHTGLDPRLQLEARDALAAQIRRIEEGRYGAYRHPVPGSDDEADAANGSPYLQGMVAAMDPHTGEVRALVGGRDFAESQFNRATQARRQPGSAFKPIVYAAAFERGLTPTTRLETSPVVIEGAGTATWRPGDHIADSVETLTAREAVTVSSNNAAVRVGRWAGEDRVAAMGRRLGLTTPIPSYPSIHLGSAEVIPLELVAAYAAFGNGGYRVAPRLIGRVEDDEGNVLWNAPTGRRQVLDAGVAFLTLTLMEDVVNRGTAAIIRDRGFWQPAAGKTGTTNDGKDVWFVGMTPDVVAGVWLGFDRPANIIAGGSGGRLAAPVWADVMKEVYEERSSPAPWLPPANIVSAQVDTETGALATGDCPRDQVRIEYYLVGTEPTESCPLHGESGVERFFEGLWRNLKKVF